MTYERVMAIRCRNCGNVDVISGEVVPPTLKAVPNTPTRRARKKQKSNRREIPGGTPDGYMMLTEVPDLLGISYDQVRMEIRSRGIKTVKKGRRILVSDQEVSSLMALLNPEFSAPFNRMDAATLLGTGSAKSEPQP